jgi:Domain of unknown function (DUF4126)
VTDPLSTIALAAGLGWASGFRLYLLVFALGALGRLGVVVLPEHLQLLSDTPILALSGTLFAAEFLADKVPGFDSIWDAVHTFIRIPAGALLAAGTVAGVDPRWTLAAALLGGALAGTSHVTKAGTRALLNTSPEPFTNWTASFAEDAVAVGGLWAAFVHPAAFLVLLGVFLLGAAWLAPKVWRGLRRVWNTIPRRSGARRPRP